MGEFKLKSFTIGFCRKGLKLYCTHAEWVTLRITYTSNLTDCIRDGKKEKNAKKLRVNI